MVYAVRGKEINKCEILMNVLNEARNHPTKGQSIYLLGLRLASEYEALPPEIKPLLIEASEVFEKAGNTAVAERFRLLVERGS